MTAHSWKNLICLRKLLYEYENGKLIENTVLTFQSGDGSANIHCRSAEDARAIARAAEEVARYIERTNQ